MAALLSKGKGISNSLSLTASRMNSYEVYNAAAPATSVVSTVYGHKTFNAREQISYTPFTGLKLTGRFGFYMRELPREVDAPERYRSYSAGLHGEWKFTESDRLELSYAFDQYDKSQYRRSGIEIRNYSNVQNAVRAQLNHHFSENHILILGSDFMREYLLNTKLSNSQRAQDNFDIFAQYDWSPCKKWEVVATMRYDYISEGRISHVTPKISARFSANRRLNLRLAYGTGFRAPTLKEKYYEFDMAGIWIVKGNAKLKPEQSHNINISADYTRRQYNITATAFYNYIENRITTGLPYSMPDNTRQLYLDYINLKSFHSLGAELCAQAAWNCGLRAKISYACTYEHNVRDRSDKDVNNQYMPARPHSLTAQIDWHRDFSNQYMLALNLNGRFLSAVSNKEYKDYYNLSAETIDIKYPAYTIWKLSISRHSLKS